MLQSCLLCPALFTNHCWNYDSKTAAIAVCFDFFLFHYSIHLFTFRTIPLVHPICPAWSIFSHHLVDLNDFPNSLFHFDFISFSPPHTDKFLLVEIGWFLLGLCQYQWKPTLSRLMSAAILQVCLALDVPQPGFHFPIATPTRASPICPCVIAPDVYQQSNHLNLQHGGMFAYKSHPSSSSFQTHTHAHAHTPCNSSFPHTTTTISPHITFFTYFSLILHFFLFSPFPAFLLTTSPSP
jgi:hypothetical protein